MGLLFFFRRTATQVHNWARIASGTAKEKVVEVMQLMYQSNRSLNIPPGHTLGIWRLSCPRGREFDELSLPGGGAFDHYSQGVGNLIASLNFILRIALIPNHGGDKSWGIHSERYLIRGGLAEKKRLAQALLCIWRYLRTIYIIFGM